MVPLDLTAGALLCKLPVTPDKHVPYRYAGASGDFNPIHIDAEFALDVGLPGLILHGLWTMAQVARVHVDATSDPARLKRLSVQFRGMGVPEREIVFCATIRENAGDRIITDTAAVQDGKRIIRNGEAEIAL